MGLYAVTGSGSGIGAATTEVLKSLGHDVIGVDLHGADINADLSSADGRNSAIEQLKAACGERGLDGLVTSAGVGPDADPVTLLPGVNYFGTVEMVEALLPHLSRVKGAVVCISSNSAIWDSDPAYLDALERGDFEAATVIAENIEGQNLYQGSKKAVARWMRRKSSEMAAAGVRINAVAPGFIHTNMTKGMLEEGAYKDAIAQFLESIPVGRGGRPEDIAQSIVFLLDNDKAAFIVGSVLFIDGGHDAVFRPELF